MGFNDKVKDAVLVNALHGDRFTSHLHTRVDKMWGEMEGDLRGVIAKINTGQSVSSANIKRQVAGGLKTIQKHHTRMQGVVGRELGNFANFSGGDIVSKVNDLAGISLFKKTGDMRALVRKQLIVGQPGSSWWARQASAAKTKFGQQIRLGVLAGESQKQITSRILDGVGSLKLNKAQAKALVRTSVSATNNAALEATFKANSDVISGIEADATLDARTTDICLGRDGGIWDIETGAATAQSQVQSSYPGPPPWHMQCRTVIIPVVRSLKKLGKKAGIRVGDIPKGTRATMDGQVPSSTTATEWLESKGAEFGKEQLGAARYKLWKKGKITLQQLTDQSGRSLNLTQLRQLAAGKSTKQAKKALLIRKPKTAAAPKEETKPKKSRGQKVREDVEKASQEFDTAVRTREAYRESLQKKYGTKKKLWEKIDDRELISLEKLTLAQNQAQKRALQNAQNAIELPSSKWSRPSTKFPAGWSVEQEAIVFDAGSFMRKVVHKDAVKGDWKLQVKEIQGHRASANSPKATAREFLASKKPGVTARELGLELGKPSTLNLSKSRGSVTTAVHEMGHTLEFTQERIQKSAKAFLAKRAKADPKGRRRLSTINEGKSYRSDEWAWEDKFMDAYMGKDYGEWTELVSMGVEWLWKDPTQFARRDPEMFEWLINLLQSP